MSSRCWAEAGKVRLDLAAQPHTFGVRDDSSRSAICTRASAAAAVRSLQEWVATAVVTTTLAATTAVTVAVEVKVASVVLGAVSVYTLGGRDWRGRVRPRRIVAGTLREGRIFALRRLRPR